MDSVAVIRKEKGQYCVRSPDNSDWSGGCYDSKGEAEKRLKQVEYFKHKNAARRVYERYMDRQADTVWLVRDWDNRVEYAHELCFPESLKALPNFIQANVRAWARGNMTVFMDKESATKDMERRLRTVDAQMLKSGFYRHMHSDGRIIYVSVPDTAPG